MTEDSLDALWQSDSPGPKTEDIMLHIQLEERSQRQLGWLFSIVTTMAFIAVVYVELLGAFKVPGLLLAIVSFGALCTWYAIKQAREQREDTTGLSPRGMLEYALKRAQMTLKFARGLQYWLPAGGVVGFFSGPFLAREEPWHESTQWVDATVLVVVVVVTISAVAVGTFIARDAKFRIKTLERRLSEFDDERAG